MLDGASIPLDSREVLRFLDEQRRFVQAELAGAQAALERVWARPVAQRVAEGIALQGVVFEEVGPDGVALAHVPLNESRFREGDPVVLSRGDPHEEQRITAMLEAEHGTALTLRLERPSDGVLLNERPEGWVLDAGLMDLSHYYLSALGDLSKSEVGRERALPLLAGAYQPAYDALGYSHALDLAEELELNEQQGEALARAYATDMAHLVQGPPGTGKTAALALLAHMLVLDGERVLVTSMSHRAINHALKEIATLPDATRRRIPSVDLPPVPVLKVGSEAHADEAVENAPYFASSPLASLRSGYVVGATPFALRTQRLSGVSFDTIIVDEASQVTLPLAAMAMLCGKRYIFFGDHRQLPPVVQSLAIGRAQQSSIFSHLMGRGFDTLLTESYRLSPELVAWPSSAFYENRLRSVQPASTRFTPTFRRHADILSYDQPLVFVDLQHREMRTRCRVEAELAVELVSALMEARVAPDDIGIIAPYRAQGRLIRTRIRERIFQLGAERIVCDTVERMQGRECEVLILSLTTSATDFASTIADFLFQPERLNVSVTRPRRKLIILGSSALLDTPIKPEDEPALERFRDLLRQCVRIQA